MWRAEQIVEFGVKNLVLRDEIFCQLIKQTKSNPEQKSTELGWQLMVHAICAYPPTRGERDLQSRSEDLDLASRAVASRTDFEAYLVKYVLDNYHGPGGVSNLAPYVYFRLLSYLKVCCSPTVQNTEPTHAFAGDVWASHGDRAAVAGEDRGDDGQRRATLVDLVRRQSRVHRAARAAARVTHSLRALAVD